MRRARIFPLLIVLCLGVTHPLNAQTGTVAEPVAYVGGEICNPRLHDGGFRYAIGTENIQVMRANRQHGAVTDPVLGAQDSNAVRGWTYNHAPNMTYWNGRFYLEYLSNPKDEQQPPGHTLLVTSADGRHWGKPEVVFPVYKAPKGVTIPKPYYGYIMHQRMGFYTAPNGRLLIVGFYGHSYNPFKEGGIGRVVREMRSDGTMGPIYFIRYSSHTHWSESNTTYPFFERSRDKGFMEACRALLGDKLKTLQWIDEDRGLDGFYTLKDSINRVQATSYYHRHDGKVVALWKWSYAALSDDGGLSWSTPVRCPSLIMAGGKQWGQRTKDGRYALAFNPIETQPYRYPLTVMTSSDGIVFDPISVVHGEVPPRRFMGENKDFGPCYVRGITEREQTPPDSNLWLCYSVNKEDIWVSRTPLPVRTVWEGPVKDDFNGIAPDAPIPNWNIYRPQWCEVRVDSAAHLLLSDADPYDYARAIRVFQPSVAATIRFRVNVETEGTEPFEVDVTDRHGTRALSLAFFQGRIMVGNQHCGTYQKDEWKTVTITLDNGCVAIDGRAVEPLHAVRSVERLSFRTGAYRNLPDRNTPNQKPAPPLPHCDEPTTASRYLIDDVSIDTTAEDIDNSECQ